MVRHPAGRTVACLALTAFVYALAPAQDPLRLGLALFTLVGSLWLTQALHLTITALLVPLAAVLTGLLTTREALGAFSHPIIFLFLGGFTLAAALERQGLDRALAVSVLRLARGRRSVAILLLFALAAFLSMWLSNTATTAMMLPLAMGLMRGNHQGSAPLGPREQTFVLLGLAYSAGIGGVGTLVGSPPNAIAAAQVGIDFVEWARFGVPMALLLMPPMVVTLALVMRPALGGRIEPVGEPLEWTRERIATVVIFALTVIGWVAGAPLAKALDITQDMDTIVALGAIVLLYATGTLGWPDIERGTQWGVLLLFGGGLALSQVMSASGANRFLADQMLAVLQGAPLLVVVLGMMGFVVMLTGFVSNTAAAALLVPFFVDVGGTLGLAPKTLATAVAIAASCAFMLPVSTPPNAIVFGTGKVPLADMLRCGLALNLVCAIIITTVIYLVGR